MTNSFLLYKIQNKILSEIGNANEQSFIKNNNFRGYPIYAVSEYASAGQQYYTTSNNYNPTVTNGHSGQYVAVDEAVLGSRESPQGDPIVSIYFSI